MLLWSLLQVDGVAAVNAHCETEGELVLHVGEGKAQHHAISFGAPTTAQELLWFGNAVRTH
jgi:hypothetical protein